MDGTYESKTYKVRSGTEDLGKDYEYKMCSLLALRCVFHKVKDMWMASNADGTGNFDDIILQVKMPTNEAATYMLQLKHKENASIIQEKEFLSSSGNFSLSKYVKDIEKLHEDFRSSKKKEILRDLGNFDNIHFILFTNKGTHDYEFLEKNHDAALVTTNSNSVYRFNLRKISCFEASVATNAKFFLFPDQAHANNLDGHITEEVKKITNLLGLSKVEVVTVAKSFTDHIMEWAKGNLGRHYLTNKDIVSKLVELFLDQYTVKLQIETFDYDIYNMTVWKQISAQHTITIVDCNELVTRFLIRYVIADVQKYCKDVIENWNEPLTEEAQQSFYTNYPHFKTQMLRRIGRYGKVTPYHVYKTAWIAGELPLLLKINNPENYENILKILTLTGRSFKIIIINERAALPVRISQDAKRFESLEDLDYESLSQVVNQKVQIQGRPGAVLKDLLKDDALKHIKCHDIIRILSVDFSIGRAPTPILDYFIKRTLIKTVLRLEVLQERGEDIFLLQGNSRNMYPATLKMDSLNFHNLEDVSGIISVQGSITFDQLDKLKSLKKPLHILSVYSPNYLEWVWSYGSTKTVDPFQVELEYEVDEFMLDKTTIVSAPPGMGKSVLVNFLSQKVPTDKWILRVDLNKCQSYFRHENCKTEYTDAWVHLQKLYDDNDTKVERDVFEKFYKSKKLVVLLDGFDEISVLSKNKALNLVKSLYRGGYQVWITTRPVLRSYLEQMLEMKSVTLKPFSIQDQTNFLVNYFSKVHADLNPDTQTIQIFVNDLLKAIRKNVNESDEDFAGAPLQTKLLADAFSIRCRECLCSNEFVIFDDNFDVLCLCHTFISNKISLFLKRYGEAAFEIHMEAKENQFLLALKVVFPIDDSEWDFMKDLYNIYTQAPEKRHLLQRLGLITVDEEFNVSCIHRTIAEYLAAQWLSDNINSSNHQVKDLVHTLVKERFSHNNYKLLFSMFDRMLSEGCPLHLSIINRQVVSAVDYVDTHPGSAARTDKGGRLPLHVAALYGFQYPMPFDQHFSMNENKDKMFVIAKRLLDDDTKCARSDFLGYQPIDYALSNRSLAIADEISKRVMKPIVNACIHLSLREDYLGYCYSHHSNLYKVLLTSFVSRDLLLKNIQKGVKIRDYTKYSDDHNKETTMLQLLRSSSKADTCLSNAIAFGSKPNIQKVLKGADINRQDVDGCTPLHYAIFHRETEIVKMVLEKGAHVNKQNNEKNTPLHLAAINTNFKTIKLLLSKGANVNATNKTGDTVLHLVIQKYSSGTLDKLIFSRLFVEIIKLLLEAGSNVNAENKRGEGAFHCAIKKGSDHMAAIACLLKAGAEINKASYGQQTPLHLAVQYCDKSIINLLIHKGADINSQDVDGNTPLHLACTEEKLDTIRCLLKKKACTNGRNRCGNSPLHLALLNRYPITAQLLIEGGAGINLQNGEGDSPLHVAISRSLQVSAMLLADKGAGLNLQNQEGDTPLHVALAKGHSSMAEFLIEKKADVSVKNNSGNAPLHLASMTVWDGIVELLLKKGSGIDHQNKDGNSPLHLALLKKYTSIAKLLVRQGACINLVNSDGNTSLHLAVATDREDTVKLFLDNHIYIKNKDGNTPLHLALLKGHTSIAKLLVNEGAKVNVENFWGNTPLHVALLKGQDAMTKLLIKETNVDAKNKEGNTPLHLASMELNSVNAVQLLLSRGANKNAKNNLGNTPLHVAAEKGRVDIVNVLILESEIHVNDQNQEGNTPLHVALLKGHSNVVKALVNQTHLHLVNNEGNTPLHLASASGSKDAINLLLEKAANINARNGDGNTPLHLATNNFQFKIIHLLLTKNTDIMIENNDGDTPLHLACWTGWEETVKLLLLNKEIDVNVRNKRGNTPLHMAAKMSWKRTSTLLLSRGANMGAVNEDGNTPLHLALMKEYTGVSELLIDSGSNIFHTNNEGNTPLHLAAMKYDVSTAKLLLSKCADANAKNNDGNTPLHLASKMGLINTVKVLIGKGANIEEKNINGQTPLDLVQTGNFSDDVKDLLRLKRTKYQKKARNN